MGRVRSEQWRAYRTISKTCESIARTSCGPLTKSTPHSVCLKWNYSRSCRMASSVSTIISMFVGFPCLHFISHPFRVLDRVCYVTARFSWIKCAPQYEHRLFQSFSMDLLEQERLLWPRRSHRHRSFRLSSWCLPTVWWAFRNRNRLRLSTKYLRTAT